MAVVDALQNLLDAMGRIRFTVELTSNNVLKQVTTGHQIKDEVVIILLLDAIV